MNRKVIGFVWTLMKLTLSLVILLELQSHMPGKAHSNFAPWNPNSLNGVESLVYASSTTVDVQRILGAPDEIVQNQQMYPIVQNYYYFEEGGSGAASVLVFENGILVGMHYKAPDNQLVDLTYFLNNNGDRILQSPYLASYRGYVPYFPMYSWR